LKTIKQTHHIQASVEEVYIALTNPFTIELWSGCTAVMSTDPDSEFSLFEGDILGKNLEFIENKLIRQQWYFEGDTDESNVTLLLIPDKSNTIIELTHTFVPENIYDEMVSGWKNIYFKSLKQFFK
jgi:activator of HSP90 ATPase